MTHSVINYKLGRMTRFELANDGATIRCVRPLHHMRHISVQYILYLKLWICKVIYRVMYHPAQLCNVIWRKGKFLLEDNKINKPTKIVFIIYIIFIIGLTLFRAATGDTYKLQVILIEMGSVLLIMVSTIVVCIIILIRDKISKHR